MSTSTSRILHSAAFHHGSPISVANFLLCGRRDSDSESLHDQTFRHGSKRIRRFDKLLELGLIPNKDRWHGMLTRDYPCFAVNIVTGDSQIFEIWSQDVKFPRAVELRVALRGVHESNRRVNTLKRQTERKSSDSTYFKFEH